jgi:CRISPR-associated exonuclease Cas4
MADAHRWQLLYYLYYLHERGVDAIGVLNYPLLNKKETIEPKARDFEEMEKIIDGVKSIVSGDMPSPVKRKLCKKCSYYEFCFGGEE